ncbi:MAG: class D sortase [Wenzhouxiangella sp.]
MTAAFFGAHFWTEVERQRSLADFAASHYSSNASVSAPDTPASPRLPGDADRSASPSEPSAVDEVVAIIRAEAIGLELPVRYGTEERVLRRGPGIVEGTALPGSNGNVSIAAHRDTHFRSLKDLTLGDRIELEVPGSNRTYIVTELSIVDPTDIQVLDDTGHAVMTLVTCYPFHFVGNAPKRFIVRAEAADSMQASQ